MIDPGLEGRVVLITGANTGIGAATARAFGAQGAWVILHYLEAPAQASDPGVAFAHEAPGRASAESVAKDVERLGGRAILVEGDLSRKDAARQVFQEAESSGPVEVLVNNAAHCELPDSVRDATADSIDRHFAVNARAAVLLMREFVLRQERREGKGGRIINVSTDAARAFATQIGYGASKAALEAFTRSVAIEVGPLGVNVNAVAPGPVQTGWMTSKVVEQVTPTIPLRRVGTPEDIADTIVFLASEQAGWISGQVIQVAGGHAL